MTFHHYDPIATLTDDERESLVKALNEAQHRPWIVASGERAGRNWILAYGRDAANVEWYLTTDHLHASQMRASSAEKDARACALAVNAAPRLLAEVERMTREVARLRAKLDDMTRRQPREEP